MAGLNKEIEQLELQIKFLEIEIQKANTVNIDLQKQLTLTDVGCSLPTKKIINYLEKQEDFYIEEVEIANKFYNAALNDVLYFIVKEEEKLK